MGHNIHASFLEQLVINELGDQPTEIRKGEELPSDALHTYLITQIPGATGEIEILQFPGGHSNLTYLIKLGDREYVLRRPPIGAKIKTAHDMSREFTILSGLDGIYAKIPKPILMCEDESVIGAPFYLMERVHGLVLRKAKPSGVDLSPQAMRALSESFIDNLIDIHSLDIQDSSLAQLGHPEGYVERQITGWVGRYQKAKTEEIPEIEKVAIWLQDEMPAESGTALIHNDYRYENLILDPSDISRIRAVLDWEMATIGDPLMDLGCALCYWIESNDPPELQSVAFGLTSFPGNLTRAELVARYFERSNKQEREMLYYYVYALFKLAVIIQQIYARYAKGLTQDERFAHFDQAVKALGAVAHLAIQKGRIDRLA